MCYKFIDQVARQLLAAGCWSLLCGTLLAQSSPPADTSTPKPVAPRNSISPIPSPATAGSLSTAFSPDGRLLATGSWDTTAKLWDVASGKEVRTLAHHQMGVTSVAFSPDGRLLAVGSDDTTVSLWEVATGRMIRSFDDHGSYVLAVAFSPDGRTLASSTSHTKIKLWDVATGQEVRTLTGHAMAVYCLAFTPDGRQLASGSRDSSIKFWDVPGGTMQRSLNLGADAGHEAFYVYSMAFSPDGRTLAAGTTGGFLKVLDVASGDCRCFIRAGNNHPYVRPIALDPRGQWLAAGDYAGVQFWDATTGAKLGKLRGLTMRDRIARRQPRRAVAGLGERRRHGSALAFQESPLHRSPQRRTLRRGSAVNYCAGITFGERSSPLGEQQR